MRNPTPKLFVYMLAAMAVILITFLLPVVGQPGWMPELISREGAQIDSLAAWMLVLYVVILGVVAGAVAFSVVHFRAAAGDESDGEPIHGDHRLELAWTIIPAIIVVAISFASWRILVDAERPAPADRELTVEVEGFQFGWLYHYPDHGVENATSLVLPEGDTTLFEVRSRENDVVHSFWVPEARLKIDAVPGVPTRVQWTPTRVTGPDDRYQVVCTELCGSGHNAMRSDVCVVSQEDFDAWTKADPRPSCEELRNDAEEAA